MNDDQDQDATLRALAGRLGVTAAERLDVERIARTVVERLRTEPRAQPRREVRRWTRTAWLRIAAAVVLLAGAGLVAHERFFPQPHPSHYVAEELGDLSADQLRDVLGSLDQTLNDVTLEPSEEDLDDLTTEQLQALLQSLEG